MTMQKLSGQQAAATGALRRLLTALGVATLYAGAPALAAEEPKCAETDTGITLPKGFCATIFADNIGHARQMAVAPTARVYVNTWSGVYYNNDKPPAGGFLVALKDTKGDGHADQIERFGETVAEGGKGGTGIAIYKDWLYAEINDRIVRYPAEGRRDRARRASPRRSSAACRSPATTRCIRSSSTPRATCSSPWARPPTPAR